MALFARPGGDSGPAHARLDAVFAKGHHQLLGAEENHPSLRLAQLGPGGVDVEAVGLADGVHHLEGDLAVDGVAIGQSGHEGPPANAPARVGHQQGRVELVFLPQSVAGRAGSERPVEAEVAPGEEGLLGVVSTARKPQPQQVEHARQRSHRRARVRGRAALAHGEGHRQAEDSLRFGPA